MPIWLRNFTYNKILEFYEKEKEQYEKSSGKNSGNSFDIGSGQKVPEAVKQAAQRRVSYK